MTGREFVSQIRSSNKLISADNSISDRFLLREGNNAASLLIKRETNLRKLWNSPNIFTLVECMEMEQIPLSECCDYKSSCIIARTVKEIPQITEGIFGLLIQYVISPGLTKFDYASVDRFVNILKMGIKNTKKYYWVSNGKIYVSNGDIEAINLAAYFDREFDSSTLSACKPKSVSTSCINPLDKEMRIPSYMIKSVMDLVNENLMKTYFRHLEDPTSNDKDEQR